MERRRRVPELKLDVARYGGIVTALTGAVTGKLEIIGIGTAIWLATKGIEVTDDFFENKRIRKKPRKQ